MPLEDKSYVTIAEADEYWDDRNDPGWDEFSEAEKTAGLIRATEWIDTSFQWIGYVDETDQVLAWPRIHAVDGEGRKREGIPHEVKNAVSWLAKEAVSVELDPAQARGGDIKRVKAGSVEVEWNDFAPTGKSYRHVKTLLKNLISGTKLRRA